MNNINDGWYPRGEMVMQEEMITTKKTEQPQMLMEPGEALVALYNAAITRTELAMGQINADGNEARNQIIRVQEIILELCKALDYSMDEALCANLEMIYHFMIDRLAIAARDKNEADLKLVHTYLSSMRDTWRQAVDGQRAASEFVVNG